MLAMEYRLCPFVTVCKKYPVPVCADTVALKLLADAENRFLSGYLVHIPPFVFLYCRLCLSSLFCLSGCIILCRNDNNLTDTEVFGT